MAETLTALKGLLVSLPAPFDSDGGLDLIELGRVANYCSDSGIRQFVFGGTTSEGANLNVDELISGCRAIKQTITDGVVLMGLLCKTETDIRGVMKALKEDAAICDGLLLAFSPWWVDTIYARQLDCLAEANKPIVIYSLPPRFNPQNNRGNAGVLTTNQVIQFAQHPNVVGVKHADIDVLRELKRLGVPIGLLCGSDLAIGHLLLLDCCDGCVSAGALLFPREFVQIGEGFGDSLGDNKEIARDVFVHKVRLKLQACFVDLRPPEVVYLVKLYLMEKGLISCASSHYYNAYCEKQALENRDSLSERIRRAGLI